MRNRLLFIQLVCCAVVNSIAQQKDSIKLNRFYPEYFSKVQTGYNVKEECNDCYPQDPDVYGIWEGLLINCPQRIYYFPGIDSVPQLPYCSFERVNGKKAILYKEDSYKIYVNDMYRDSLVYDIFSSETRVQRIENANDIVIAPWLEFNRNIGNKLSVALRNGAFICASKQCVNIFDYLNLPFKSGIYDVSIQRCGYESNHVKTEIIFANNQTLFYPESFNRVKLGFELDISSLCLPQLPHMQSSEYVSFLKINIPSEIYHYPHTDTTEVFPICSSSFYLKKDDILKQGNIVEIFIKDLSKNKIYKGKADFDGRDAYGNTNSEFVVHYPKNSKERKEKAAEIDERKAVAHAFNINALDFVDMPYKAGEYEVWVKRAGYESNHMKVTIKFFYEK